MTEIFQHNGDIVRTILLVDDAGISLEPEAITYVVLDENAAEIVASTALAVTTGMEEAVVTVPAVSNDLGVERTGVRAIVLTIETAIGAVLEQSDIYILKNGSLLELWENTFQSYYQTVLISTSIPNLGAWDAASRSSQEAALIDAFHSVSKLSFSLPERIIVGAFPQNFILQDLTTEEWGIIPAEFLRALRSAQLVESDFLLGGSPIETKRRAGMMSETIGESSNMFRQSKPVTSAVCDRAYRYLQLYISHTSKLSRG